MALLGFSPRVSRCCATVCATVGGCFVPLLGAVSATMGGCSLCFGYRPFASSHHRRCYSVHHLCHRVAVSPVLHQLSSPSPTSFSFRLFRQTITVVVPLLNTFAAVVMKGVLLPQLSSNRGGRNVRCGSFKLSATMDPVLEPPPPEPPPPEPPSIC